MLFLCLSYILPMSSLCFPMLFLCLPYASPMSSLCSSYAFPMSVSPRPLVRAMRSLGESDLDLVDFFRGKDRCVQRRAAQRSVAERTEQNAPETVQLSTSRPRVRQRTKLVRDRFFFFEKKIARQQTLTEKLFSPRWADCTHTAVYNSLYTVGIRGCTWAIVTAVQSSLTSVAYIASKANRSCINAYRRPGRAHARSAFPFAVVKPSSSCCCHPLGRRWPGCVAAGRVGIGRGAHAGGS